MLALPPRTLAKADAYLVFNRGTGHAYVVHGAQADYVLSEVYEDYQVRPDRGGAYVVTLTSWQVIKYVPLHRDQMLQVHLSDQGDYAGKLSSDGRTFQTVPPLDGKALAQLVKRGDGEFYRTLDDYIIRVQRGRVLGMWQPFVLAA